MQSLKPIRHYRKHNIMDTSTHSFAQNSHYGTKGPSSTSVRGRVSQEYYSNLLVVSRALMECVGGGMRNETLRALAECGRLGAEKYPSRGHCKKIDLALVLKKLA